MFISATITQIKFMLKQKGAVFSFYILLLMVLSNFINNVLEFQGMEVIRMYHPMKLLLLSYNRVNYSADATLLLIQLYPLLVICPAGFSLVKEQQSKEEVYIIARLGQRIYKFSKLIASFLTTTIVFVTPFLVEIILNCLSFPLSANGDFMNLGVYNVEYIRAVQNYLMSGLFLKSPYFYAVVGTPVFGIVSGLFGAFTVAFSSIIRVKYRVLLFLPVSVLLNTTLYLSGIFDEATVSFKWFDYLLLFNNVIKSPTYLIAGILILVIFSTCAVYWSGRKECL